MASDQTFYCIDLRSFFASVECVDRGYDPLTTNLVVADPNRYASTLCLAITPSMKALGIRNRCRLNEIPPEVKYVIARPRMQRYMQVSAAIYGVYLQFFAASDMHLYSIDECFIDASTYLRHYRKTPRELAQQVMRAVLEQTGISATCGIGSNLFLAKVALDVTAKNAKDGIGILNNQGFREKIWFHQPLTDIWQIGTGTAAKLAQHGIHNLAQIAAADPKKLHRLFGANAEYLIDHAWGLEPCQISDIHAYTPKTTSLSNSQILSSNYSFAEARVVLREMVEQLLLDMHRNQQAANHIQLYVGYAHTPERQNGSTGGSRRLSQTSAAGSFLTQQFLQLYDETTLTSVPIRRLGIGVGALVPVSAQTVTLFDDVKALQRESQVFGALAAVKDKFGKNALLKGTSLRHKATGRERNAQIGGHRA